MPLKMTLRVLKVSSPIVIFLLLTVGCGTKPAIDVVIPSSVCEGATAQRFTSGLGTASDPYLICNADQFALIQSDLSAHYKLVRDLDFTGKTLNSIGTESAPFTGTLDGNYKKMKGITKSLNAKGAIDRDGGLFRHVKDATIKSLKLEATLTGTAMMVGAIVGFADGVTLERVSFDGYLRGVSYTGGLVGAIGGGTNVFRQVAVRGQLINAGSSAGALIGYIFDDTSIRLAVEDSYSNLSVDSTARYIAHYDAAIGEGTITRFLFAGYVHAGVHTLATSSRPEVVASSSFVDSTLNSVPAESGVTGASTASLKQAATYVGWDFASVWQIKPDNYPSLRWEQ